MSGDRTSAIDSSWEEPDTARAIGALWDATDNPCPKGNFNAVAAALQSIAAGNMDENDRWFAQVLAQRLLRAAQGAASPQRRASDVFRASGLTGREDRDAEALEALLVLDGLPGVTPAACIDYARRIGALAPDVDDKAARQMLSRARMRQ